MADFQQLADGSVQIIDLNSVPTFRSGGALTRVGGAAATNTNVANFRGVTLVVARIQGPTDTAGGIAALANPFGVLCYVLGSAQLIVTTASTAACTASIGIAANATTLSATLFSGINVNATGSTNSVLVPSWGATQFLTASTATGASAGLVGIVAVPVFVP